MDIDESKLPNKKHEEKERKVRAAVVLAQSMTVEQKILKCAKFTKLQKRRDEVMKMSQALAKEAAQDEDLVKEILRQLKDPKYQEDSGDTLSLVRMKRRKTVTPEVIATLLYTYFKESRVMDNDANARTFSTKCARFVIQMLNDKGSSCDRLVYKPRREPRKRRSAKIVNDSEWLLDINKL